MTLSMNKLSVLFAFKLKELLKNKTFLISFLMVPLLTFCMKFAYENMLDGALPPALLTIVLNLGVLYNLTAIALMMPATMLAKDKEKSTLRTLMTSSVNAGEYFISGVLPSFIASLLINAAVLLISGVQLSGMDLALFFASTALACLTSCVIGMVIGIFSKNQMASSNLVTLFMLVFMFVPMLSGMIDSLQIANEFLYTGIISNMITSVAVGGMFQLSMKSWIILGASAVFSILLFVFFYKRNGFEKD